MSDEGSDRLSRLVFDSSFRDAVTERTVTFTDVDVRNIERNFPQLGEVVNVYLTSRNPRNINDFALTRQPNPLQAHLDQLERRHR